MAVVGILGAALHNPVWTSAILSPYDFALALLGLVLLVAWKTPPWLVVVLLAVEAQRSRLSRFCPHKRDSQGRVVVIHFRAGGGLWPDLI